MIRRSSIVAALVAMFAAGSIAAAESAGRQSKLSIKTARAQTEKVMAKERANVYGARDLVGGDFTVGKISHCVRATNQDAPYRVVCHYSIWSVAPVDPSAAKLEYKRCAASASVRKAITGKRNVTAKRWAVRATSCLEVPRDWRP